MFYSYHYTSLPYGKKTRKTFAYSPHLLGLNSLQPGNADGYCVMKRLKVDQRQERQAILFTSRLPLPRESKRFTYELN